MLVLLAVFWSGVALPAVAVLTHTPAVGSRTWMATVTKLVTGDVKGRLPRLQTTVPSAPAAGTVGQVPVLGVALTNCEPGGSVSFSVMPVTGSGPLLSMRRV